MSGVAGDARPAASNRVAWQQAGGEAVIIDLEGRRVMGLNATGSLVWTHINGTRTVEELAVLVAREFDIDAAAARADVDAFVVLMKQRGFLTLH